MGAPAQQPVYYDTDEGQYYTMKNQQNTVATSPASNGVGAIFGNMFGNLASQSGMPNKDNPFYDPDTTAPEQKEAVERRLQRIHVLNNLY